MRSVPGAGSARRGLILVLVMVAAMLSVLPSVAAAPPPSCQLVPVLKEVLITQGAPTNRPLVRGREGLVRVYLSLPSCAGKTDSITLKGATLAVDNGGAALAPLQPLSPLGPTYPLIAPFSTSPSVGGPGDPTFVMPASYLRPASTDAFTLTVTPSITYAAKSGNTTFPDANLTLTSPSIGGLQAPVQRQTNNVRVIGVPLGDGNQTYRSQFPESAEQVALNSRVALSRIFPVPEGIDTVTAPAATVEPGLRLSINPALLGIQHLMTNSNGSLKFCGSGANYPDVAAPLGQVRLSFNSVNTDTPADLVMGLIDNPLNVDSCAFGYAGIPANEAWVRTVPEATTPSLTGSLYAMEVGHDMGLVPESRDNAFDFFHAPSTNASGSTANRAYNVPQRKLIADDRNVMKLSGTWNNDTTFFDGLDWAFLQCRLGSGTTTAECPTSGSYGQPAGATPLLMLSGTTDLTAANTSIIESFFTPSGLATGGGADGELVLRQSRSGLSLREDRVDVAFADIEEHGAGAPSDDRGVFAAAVPFNPASTRIELLAGGTLLYAVNRNLDPVTGADAPPRVTRTTVTGGATGGPRNFTQDRVRDDLEPALTDDGRLVAWSDRNALYVDRADRTSSAPDVLVIDDASVESIGDPAWSSDGRALAFVVAEREDDYYGDLRYSLYVVDVDPDGGEFFQGEPRQLVSGGFPGRYISDPTWETGGAGRRIAFETLALIRSGEFPYLGGPQVRIVSAADPDAGTVPVVGGGGEMAREPSWSHTPGDNRIAFIASRDCRQAESSEGCEPRLELIDPDDLQSRRTLLDGTAGFGPESPSWGTDGRIAFVAVPEVVVNDVDPPNGVWVVPADGKAGDARQLTQGRSDAEPAFSGGRLAFERSLASDVERSQRDIFLLDLSEKQTVTVDAVAPGGTAPADPADLRLDLFVACAGGPKHVVAAGLRPAATDAPNGTARFTQLFDTSLVCGGAPVVHAVVSDGILRSNVADPAAQVAVQSTPKPPVVAIYSPALPGAAEPDGTRVLQHEAIALRGSASDAEDGTPADLHWFVNGAATPAASGQSADLAPLPVGQHTITLRATDSSGLTAEATRRIEVLADADRDGVPAVAESCASDTDATDAFGDSDADGMPNIDDWVLTQQPCTAATAFRAVVDLDPDTLNLGSNGRYITAYISVPYRTAAELDPATVALRFEGASPQHGATGCPARTFPAVPGSWQGTTTPGGAAVAKFDRQAVASYLRSCGARGPVRGDVTATSFPRFGPYTVAGSDTFTATH